MMRCDDEISSCYSDVTLPFEARVGYGPERNRRSLEQQGLAFGGARRRCGVVAAVSGADVEVNRHSRGFAVGDGMVPVVVVMMPLLVVRNAAFRSDPE